MAGRMSGHFLFGRPAGRTHSEMKVLYTPGKGNCQPNSKGVYFNYHGVPGNIDSLQSFRAQVVWHWSRALQRRSQKSRMPWERFGPLVARWIPSAVILHPRPVMRFNARYLR